MEGQTHQKQGHQAQVVSCIRMPGGLFICEVHLTSHRNITTMTSPASAIFPFLGFISLCSSLTYQQWTTLGSSTSLISCIYISIYLSCDYKHRYWLVTSTSTWCHCHHLTNQQVGWPPNRLNARVKVKHKVTTNCLDPTLCTKLQSGNTSKYLDLATGCNTGIICNQYQKF